MRGSALASVKTDGPRAEGSVNRAIDKTTKVVESEPVPDVGLLGEQITERGATALHQKNLQAARGGALSFGGAALDQSRPSLARFATDVPSRTERDQRLRARARPVLSAQHIDTVAKEALLPLAALIGGGAPDPARFNGPTWTAFQLASTLPQAARGALFAALASGAPMSKDVPPALVRALRATGVDIATLGQLMRAHDLVTEVVGAELPSLPLDERSRFCGVVHDAGYAREQLARTASPTALLCRSGGQGAALLDDARLALLHPNVRARFSPQERARHAGTDAAMPRLTLAELVRAGEKDALQFLASSGKDIGAKWSELGDQTPATFLKRRAGESERDHLARLASKQVLNPFARSWDALLADAQALGAAGGDTAMHLAFLHKKQEPAVAPALLFLAAPALFQRAAPETLDALMQVCFRVAHPAKPFSDPLIHQGVQQLKATLGEQLAKDRALARTVVHIETTRVLSGLRDDTYDARLGALLTDRGIPVDTSAVGNALARLVRDVGADNPRLHAALAAMDMTGPEGDVVTKLHALRHDPSLFALAVPTGTVKLGTLTVKLAGAPGDVVPELVGATTVGYRVTLASGVAPFGAGESVLLRLPKGAQLELGPDGALSFAVHDAARLKDAATRLKDFEVMEQSVSVTARTAVDVSGVPVLLEKRARTGSAAERIAAGATLAPAQVGMLADQFVRGLLDVDETRPFGVFYELGPDNYLLEDKKSGSGAGGKGALTGSYVDVAMLLRTERERGAFGFFQGGYSSAANWILGDNTPLSADAVQALWRSDTLTPAQAQMRSAFAHALVTRLDPSHPVYRGAPAEVRDRVIADLRLDARVLGLDVNAIKAHGAAAVDQKRDGPRPRKVGVFLGSFNPPHVGHKDVVENLKRLHGLDRVYVVADPVTTYKKLAPLADREAMVQALFEGTDGVAWLTPEMKSGLGAGEMWDVLRVVREAHPDAQLANVMGSDTLAWWATLPKETRGGKLTLLVNDRGDGKPMPTEIDGQTVKVTSGLDSGISSTLVREQIASGKTPESLPGSVWSYVRARGLYGTSK